MKLSDRLRRAVENGALPVYIFLILLIIPNVILGFTEKMPLMVAVVNVALPLAVYYLLLTLSPRLGRTIWLFFPVIFLDAFQIVLLWLYKRSVIAVDMFLNLVTTNPGEAGELLGNMLPSIIIVVVLYVPPLAFATVMLCKGWNIGRDSLMRQRRYALWLAIAAAPLTVAAGLGGELRFRRDIFPINALDNARLAGRHAIKLRQRAAIEPEFSFDARSVRPDSCREVIVLVVGETSRADHWALNGYGRPTNPRLMRLEADSCGRLVNFRRSLSQSNTTHKSVPLLLTHLTPENYADSIYSVRSVISAFKEAGYSTAFVTAQKHNRSFIEFFGNEADTTIYIGEDSPEKFAKAGDLGLLDYLDSILAKGARKQLVVLHCYGSHFSYRDRYPADMARFTPDSYSEISTGERDALINAYDNTIVATDSLLSGIARRLEHLGANRHDLQQRPRRGHSRRQPGFVPPCVALSDILSGIRSVHRVDLKQLCRALPRNIRNADAQLAPTCRLGRLIHPDSAGAGRNNHPAHNDSHERNRQQLPPSASPLSQRPQRMHRAHAVGIH